MLEHVEKTVEYQPTPIEFLIHPYNVLFIAWQSMEAYFSTNVFHFRGLVKYTIMEAFFKNQACPFAHGMGPGP